LQPSGHLAFGKRGDFLIGSLRVYISCPETFKVKNTEAA